MTELLDALYRGDADRVRTLLADDPELSVFEAAALGRSGRVRELVASDPTLVNAFGDDGFHPLGLACFFGHVDTARFLLESGAEVDAVSHNERIQTAAIHAAAAAASSDEATRCELVKLVL